MSKVEGKLRFVLVLGKFQVLKVEKGALGTKFSLNLGSGVTITADTAVKADVRPGDLLTLYTEVLADAESSSSPIQ
jgi:hypothetical protein